MATYSYPRFDYVAPPEIAEPERAETHPVIVVGAGMVGLTMALDLARHGIRVLVLDEDDTVSLGSRSICQAMRTLEIWHRLGAAEAMMAKGVTWSHGRVFYGERELFDFDLQDTPDLKFPAFINLQQYHVEEILCETAAESGLIEFRWRNRVTEVSQDGETVTVEIETPDGSYRLTADWLIAADGAKSAVRRSLGLDFLGQVFEDHFLIADIVMESDLATERRFWFDPPWGPEQSALLHRQADDVWRLDFQLGWDIDKEAEKAPERVMPRIKRMLGGDRDYEIEWVSIYTFQCRRLERFRHDRVLFIGDAAHQVSPFGARGGNSGVQDADNLAWKLALVIRGLAPERLLDSFDSERLRAAVENIRHSTRSTDFITPKGPVSQAYRDAVLDLAQDFPFARRLVNSGRLSTATRLADSPLSSFDSGFDGGVPLGAPAPALPVEAAFDETATHLCDILRGGFAALLFAETEDDVPSGLIAALLELAEIDVPVETFLISPLQNAGDRLAALFDRHGIVWQAFDAAPGTLYLLRPDQHVCARWREPDVGELQSAYAIALGREPATARVAQTGD